MLHLIPNKSAKNKTVQHNELSESVKKGMFKSYKIVFVSLKKKMQHMAPWSKRMRSSRNRSDCSKKKITLLKEHHSPLNIHQRQSHMKKNIAAAVGTVAVTAVVAA